MMPEQSNAVDIVAERLSWTRRSTHELGLMLWALFRYYAKRAAAETDWRKR